MTQSAMRGLCRAISLSVVSAALISTAPTLARKKQAPSLPPAETGLIDNVNGLAPGANGQLEHFTGLLIDKDGRVERRLTSTDKRPDHLAYRLDGRGQTLIPSFIDSHAQLIATGITRMTLDLSDTTSLADALAKISAYARSNDGRKWILGRGWNALKWATPDGQPVRLPTAADLDAVIADIPVWLESADGDMGWANSLAMRQTGVKTNGLFTGAELERVRQVVPQPAPKDRDIALDKAQPLFLAAGIGTVTDMGTTIDDWQTYRRAGDRGALRLRIISYADGIANMTTIAGPAPSPWLYNDHLRLAGVHFTLDGSLGSHSAWLQTDYADTPGKKGAPKISSTILRNQMSRAAMDGFQIALSAHGDAAVDEALAAIEELAATYDGDRRWRIEGAELIAPANLPHLASLKPWVSVRPSLLASTEGLALIKYVGEARSLLPLSQLSGETHQVMIGNWASGPIISPFLSIAAAMSRTDNKGNPFGGLPPTSERLTFERAFAAATNNGAHSAFADQKIGTLAPGQWADFLLIDRDISIASPADIAQTHLVEHWIAGQRVWKADALSAPAAATVR